MRFYDNQLFHIFNQGNNRQPLFFSDDNYKYFLWKMRAYLPLFGDLISYSLMPNYFHWQFQVKKVEIPRTLFHEWIDEVEYQRRVFKYGKKAKPVNNKIQRTAMNPMVSLNESIGILEKTYARAINKQQDWTGSLFRKECKAEDGWIPDFVSKTLRNSQQDFRFTLGSGYAYNCFNYIHNNAKEAGLVTENHQWEWSSARDYAGLRNGTLCNLELGRKIIEEY